MDPGLREDEHVVPETVRLNVHNAGHIGAMEQVEPSCLSSILFFLLVEGECAK